MIALTRRYHFSASHRLHSPLLSAGENLRKYGKCNNPFGHGHDYALEVTAAGEIDTLTGQLLPIAKLDLLVRDRILTLFAFRNINLDIPQFALLIPTTENIAHVIADILEQNWAAYLAPSSARLRRVHIQETPRNGFEIVFPVSNRTSSNEREIESIPVHA